MPEYTAGALLGLLKHKHPLEKGEWATFAELANGTGSHFSRRIDFLAMNMYPSKKFRTIAYEIKVSRADFLNELKDPRKRKFAETVAHECYFVVPHKLIDKSEVPEGWGLYYADAGGLKRKKIAIQRDSVTWPQPFIVSIARRSADPPPVIPDKIWKMSGEELTEKDLLELTKDIQRDAIREEVIEAKYQAVEDFKKSFEFRQIMELYNTASEIFGSRYGDHASSLRALAGNKIISRSDHILTIENAIRSLNLVIKEVGETRKDEEKDGF